VLGLAYGGLALLLPAPTLETSYHFVFTVLAFGFVAFPDGASDGSTRRASSVRHSPS